MGAVAAFVASVILLVPQAAEHKVKVLDIGTMLFFLVMAILGAVLSSGSLQFLERDSQALSSAVLALIVIVGLALGRPFYEHACGRPVPRRADRRVAKRRVAKRYPAAAAAAP